MAVGSLHVYVCRTYVPTYVRTYVRMYSDLIRARRAVGKMRQTTADFPVVKMDRCCRVQLLKGWRWQPGQVAGWRKEVVWTGGSRCRHLCLSSMGTLGVNTGLVGRLPYCSMWSLFLVFNKFLDWSEVCVNPNIALYQPLENVEAFQMSSMVVIYDLCHTLMSV